MDNDNNNNLVEKLKVIWHKAASSPQMDSSLAFARWHQRAIPWGHTGATWRIRLNLCFLRSTWLHNPNGKSIGPAVFAQIMAESPYTLQLVPLPPKLPLLMRASEPQSITIPWAHPSLQPKQHLNQFRHCCTDDHRVSLYFTMGCHSPLKIAPSHEGIWTPHLIHGSLGSLECSTQMASQSVQPFLQG